MVLLVVVLSEAGCMYVKRTAEEFQKDKWPPSSNISTRSVSLIVALDTIRNGKPVDKVDLSELETSLSRSIQAWTDSGLFSSVNTGAREADYTAEMLVIKRLKISGLWSWLNVLTFGAVPLWYQQEFAITASLKNRKGDPLAHAERSESFEVFLGWIFFPLALWSDSNTEYDLNRQVILDLCSHRVFEKP